MRSLCQGLEANVVFHDVDRRGRLTAFRNISSLLNSQRWDLIYLEGTGITCGLPLILAALFRHQRFIVSSGDPIAGFFRVTRGQLAGLAFGLYEQCLYRTCSAFIGWTPYLVGAALKLGARSAATVEGGVDLARFKPLPVAESIAFRRRLGIAPGHIVCGLVGSLAWIPRKNYCYGLELIESLKQVRRTDLSVLIVGDGSGRARLEEQVPEELRSRVVFTGRLSEEDVVQAIAAMDIGFVPQSLDELGNFRLTTKLPEYLACGVPVAMSPVPGFYDYAAEAGWPLPGTHPASPEFHIRCAAWLDSLSHEEISTKANRARPVAQARFDHSQLSRKFQNLVQQLLLKHSCTAGQ